MEWRTGTVIDSYTPLYGVLLTRGVKPHEADMLDLTTVATLLGIAASGPTGRGQERPANAPSWWTDDDAAAFSSVEAARQLGFVVGELTS